MPSSLGRRKFSQIDAFNRVAERQALAPVDLPIRGPWEGYTPDLEPSVAGLNHSTGTTSGLVAEGEYLTQDLGWVRLDPTNLPLGDDGAGAADLAATDPQRIHSLDKFLRFPAGGDNNLTATTADSGGGAENSHIFKLDSGTWQIVTPTNRVADGGGITAANFTYTEDQFPDVATFSGGFTSTVSGPGGAGPNVAQPVQIICTGGSSNVMFWPSWNNVPTVVDSFDHLIERARVVGGWAATYTNFKAASAAVIQGRAAYLNVWLNGTQHPRRFMCSAVGDPTNIVSTAQGTQTIDAIELGGTGIALSRLGNVLAGYFSDGVVFYTRTFNPLAPFTPEYVSHNLGLLGNRAFTHIEEGVHFGIFEQGWYIIQETGEIIEMGLNKKGNNQLRKWQRTFYNNLDWSKAHHTNVSWESYNRRLRISFYTTGSDTPTVWIYDLDYDRVWPAFNYSAQAPLSQATFNSVTVAISYSAQLGTTYASWLGIPYGALLSQEGRDAVVHGDRNGYVYIRDPSQGGQIEDTLGNSTYPSYTYESFMMPVDGPGPWKESDRLEVEHTNVNGPDATLTIKVDDQSFSLVRDLRDNNFGSGGVAYITATLGGTHHGFKVSGTGPVVLRGFMYRYTPKFGDVVR